MADSTPPSLPTAEELQKLANAFFSARPNSAPQAEADNFLESYTDSASVLEKGQPSGTIRQPNQLNDQNLLAGGITSHSANNASIQSPISQFSSPGQFIPSSLSVSGAGVSFDSFSLPESLRNPEMVIHDFKLSFEKESRSPTGSGYSPSIRRIDPTRFEDASYQPFETNLQRIFNEIVSFLPESKNHETIQSDLSTAAYYFLSGPKLFGAPHGVKQTGSSFKSAYPQVKPPFDVNRIRQDFPLLQERVNGKQIVWLDNAATTQKPRQVIERLSYFYEHENSNVHRAAHEIAARATDAYEAARKKVQRFINADSVNEIVFVRGTTEGINLVAQSWGEQNLHQGDEIILSHLEHHANIVPWQILAKKKGLIIKVIPIDDDGQIIISEYQKLITKRTKLVAFTQVSNALGTITPAKVIIDIAHQAGARVLVDGAQSVSHMRTDVSYLDADWFVFSGHKLYGPTGIGVLYGKEALLNSMPPWQGGGNMIKDVTFEHTEYHSAPGLFEAGTGNIADAVGLGAAIDYINSIGIELIQTYENGLLAYATAHLKTIPGLRLLGTAKNKASVLSFTLDGFTNDEVGQHLNKEGIAVRTGHHCAQPVLRRLGVESSVRPSLAFYNTCSDVDRLIETLFRLKEL